jgi:hypothetical protein
MPQTDMSLARICNGAQRDREPVTNGFSECDCCPPRSDDVYAPARRCPPFGNGPLETVAVHLHAIGVIASLVDEVESFIPRTPV